MYNWLISNLYKIKRSISREIWLLKKGDEIKLQPKVYKESIHFSKDVIINGNKCGTTTLKGNITIPKGRVVEFRNVTFLPNINIKVEGKLILRHCNLKGIKTDVLVTVCSGTIEAYYCKFSFSKQIGMNLINASGIFEHCIFTNNGESHFHIDQSKALFSHCDFSKAQHALKVSNNSIVDLTQSKIHYHKETQIIVSQSKLYAYKSEIQHGSSSAVWINNKSEVFFTKGKIQHHSSNQIDVQNSLFMSEQCQIKHGNQCGVNINNSEVNIRQSTISNHSLSNVKMSNNSRVNIVNSEIFDCKGFGIEATKESILNIDKSKITNNRFAQLTITNSSICSINRSHIKGGCHIGIYIEKSNCSLVKSTVTENENSAFNVISGELNLINCDVAYNFGNGIMALNYSSVDIDNCHFYHNVLPHIACKLNGKITMNNSQFHEGQSVYLNKGCELYATKTEFYNSEQVQIDISEGSSAFLEECSIYDGKSKGISITKNSNLSLYNCQISNHDLSQIYINDSSAIIRNCDIYKGKQYGVFVQNRSEVYIQESYISNHFCSQIWIDKESIVEINSVLLTDGQQTDVYVQNQSELYVAESVIRNEKSRFNLQAVNHSKIEIMKTYIENRLGDIFYSKNNSFIKYDH